MAERHGLALEDGAVDAIARYVRLLLDVGARTNLVGTRDPARLLDEVVLDAAQLAPLLPGGPGRLIDVGSGAGLPGIPVLLLRPDWSGVLLEPRRRRAAFLRHAVRSLGLADRATVVEARLEDAVETGLVVPPFAVAAAKAVFAPGLWTERAAGLVAPGGHVAVYVNGHAEGLPDGVDPGTWCTGPTARWSCLDGSPRQLLLLERLPGSPREVSSPQTTLESP